MSVSVSWKGAWPVSVPLEKAWPFLPSSLNEAKGVLCACQFVSSRCGLCVCEKVWPHHQLK